MHVAARGSPLAPGVPARVKERRPERSVRGLVVERDAFQTTQVKGGFAFWVSSEHHACVREPFALSAAPPSIALHSVSQTFRLGLGKFVTEDPFSHARDVRLRLAVHVVASFLPEPRPRENDPFGVVAVEVVPAGQRQHNGSVPGAAASRLARQAKPSQRNTPSTRQKGAGLENTATALE